MKAVPFQEFQFLYGTIKRSSATVMCFVFIGFNSSMVQLKAKRRTGTSNSFISFNSSMVQLKAKVANVSLASTLFQFLYGTIKSLYRVKERG